MSCSANNHDITLMLHHITFLEVWRNEVCATYARALMCWWTSAEAISAMWS